MPGAMHREWWAEKMRRNIERDRDTDRRLADQGWQVEVVREHQYVTLAADEVERLVRSRNPLATDR